MIYICFMRVHVCGTIVCPYVGVDVIGRCGRGRDSDRTCVVLTEYFFKFTNLERSRNLEKFG